MKTLNPEQAVYEMSKENKPALEVEQGESFILQTKDCYSNNLKTEEDTFTKDLWDTVNPATGPVFIKGAEKGDILKVTIEKIDIRDFAATCVEKDSGALGDFIEGVETKILPIKNGEVKLTDKVSIPVNPMIGVIGTAPAKGKIPNGTPGEHGGNMDCKIICAGTNIYFPVNTAGALLSAGDIHAVMGDGEVCICGAEVSGEIQLKAEAVKSEMVTPCVETSANFNLIASAETLDECEKLVLAKAFEFLTKVYQFKANDAARFMSLACDLQVCQVVDPLKTMRFSIPKKYL